MVGKAPPAEALIKRALQHLEQKEFDRAESLCNQLLEREGPNPDVLMLLTRIQVTSGRFDQAEKSLRRLVQAVPGEAAAHNNLGNVLLELRRPAEAAASYREALRLQPDLGRPAMNIGLAKLSCPTSLRLRPGDGGFAICGSDDPPQ